MFASKHEKYHHSLNISTMVYIETKNVDATKCNYPVDTPDPGQEDTRIREALYFAKDRSNSSNMLFKFNYALLLGRVISSSATSLPQRMKSSPPD